MIGVNKTIKFAENKACVATSVHILSRATKEKVTPQPEKQKLNK